MPGARRGWLHWIWFRVSLCDHSHIVRDPSLFLSFIVFNYLMPQESILTRAAESKGYLIPRPGDLLNGRYKVIRLLGYGRYSSVMLVTDTRQVLSF